jgi:hypothetical protein
MIHVYFNYVKKLQAIFCCQHFTVHSELSKKFKCLVNLASGKKTGGLVKMTRGE